MVRQAIRMDVEDNGAMISHIRDEQPFFDGIVGDARRSSELGRPDTALTAMKILLPDDDGCGGVGVEAVRTRGRRLWILAWGKM